MNIKNADNYIDYYFKRLFGFQFNYNIYIGMYVY